MPAASGWREGKLVRKDQLTLCQPSIKKVEQQGGQHTQADEDGEEAEGRENLPLQAAAAHPSDRRSP